VIYPPSVREVEIGLVTDEADAAAAAITRTLEEPLHERHPLLVSVGGGRYTEFQLIRKFNRYSHQWRYDNDLRFVLRVKTDGDSIDVAQLLRGFSEVDGEWRVLPDSS
jgi:hypothetical protein